MPTPRMVSPGVANLIPVDLQTFIWSLYEATPLIPSIFDLRRGHGQYTQHVYHICLLPYYDKKHTAQLAQPSLNNIRVTVLSTNNGLLMRLSNKLLETQYGEKPGPEQGTLF